MGKKEELAKVAKEVRDCKRCPLWKMATNPVPGEGDPNTEVMFIGEAPGYWEDQKGRPFVGQAGKLLDNLLKSIGLNRSDVFIANVLKHRPPGNRDPLPEEIEACEAWLDRQIEIIQPEVIVTLGRFSTSKFIPDGKISRIHGQPCFINWGKKRIVVIPLFHPAAALRNAKIMEQVKEDFEKISRVLKKQIQVDEEPKVVSLKEISAAEELANEQLVLL